jgi:hypothetical protein
LVLAIFEIGTSLLLFGTVVLEVRRLRAGARDAHAAHSSHGVDWFHIFAAAVMVAEVAEHYHLTHHWRRPTILMAVFTLALGLLHGRVEAFSDRRRSLRVDDDGIYVGGRPWGSFRASWDDVESIEVGDRYGTIRAKGGRTRRIDFKDSEQPAPLRAALEGAATRVRSARLPAP